MHVHEAWTLLIVDDGAVRYDLDRHEHGTPHDTVSLLPPHVPHNGSPATPHGFRKRVLYLDGTHISDELIGAAVDQPDLARSACCGCASGSCTPLSRTPGTSWRPRAG